MPAPKLQVAPLWKLLPASTTFRVCPGVPLAGAAEVTPGGGSATENPFVRVALWASGLVTVTLRAPTVAVAAIVMLAVS